MVRLRRRRENCFSDVLFSDNRCSLHRASEWDVQQYRRLLHRIILRDKVMPPGSRIAA